MNNLQDYMKWLEDKNFSFTTINTYRKTISKYAGSISFTTEGIASWLKKMVQRLEPITCQTYTAALNSYAKFRKIDGIEWEKIYRLIPTQVKKFFTTINEQELIALKSVNFERTKWLHERNNLILDFLFYTGLRASELVKIRHRDWDNNLLKIHGKGNKMRYVFLPEFLLKYISQHSSGYLFTNDKGQKILGSQIRVIVNRKAKLAGLKKTISPHSFRRSFATILNNKGVKLTTIQKLLGHSDINTTVSYIHNDLGTLYQDYSRLWKTNLALGWDTIYNLDGNGTIT